jgi:hypothetical protein
MFLFLAQKEIMSRIIFTYKHFYFQITTKRTDTKTPNPVQALLYQAYPTFNLFELNLGDSIHFQKNSSRGTDLNEHKYDADFSQ